MSLGNEAWWYAMMAAGEPRFPPTNLRSTSRSSTSVALAWDAPSSGSPTAYRVYYTTESQVDLQDQYQETTSLSRSVTGLSASTTYRFAVVAVYAGELSGFSNEVTAATTSAPVSPVGVSPVGVSPVGVSPVGVSPVGVSPVGSPVKGGVSPVGSPVKG